MAYLVVGLHVGGGVAACRAADGVLVHQLHGADTADVAVDAGTTAHIVLGAVEAFLQHVVQHLLHQRGLARAADTRHHGKDVEREVHVDVLEVVAESLVDGDAVAPTAARLRHGDAHLSAEILCRIGPYGRTSVYALGGGSVL